MAGEDGSYVFYGSGGCSLYDTAKLRALAGFSEIFEPSYVEDLDIGFRGMAAGVAQLFCCALACYAPPPHYDGPSISAPHQLEHMVERNYLRFLARSVGDPEIFARLWRYAIDRLNWKAAIEHHGHRLEALAEAKDTVRFVEPTPAVDEEMIFAIGSGDVAVFPGRSDQSQTGARRIGSDFLYPFPSVSWRGGPHVQPDAASGSRVSASVGHVRGRTPYACRRSYSISASRSCRSAASAAMSSRIAAGRMWSKSSIHRRSVRAAQQTIRKWKPAIAQLEFTQMAMYAPACAPAKTVMVEHDVTIDLYQQLLENSRRLGVEETIGTVAQLRDERVGEYRLRGRHVGQGSRTPSRMLAGW